MLTGGCQCGALRYALYAQPEGTHLCHCRMCQKAVGGPFAALAPVRTADFAWTRGTPRTFESSSIALRDHCPDCGTPLTFRYAGSEWVDVTIGKIAPYFLVAAFDLVIVTAAGIWIFDVPFRGSFLTLGAFGFVFLFVVLGLGVAISTVSQSQGEAIQLAIMTLLPQIMLSGMIFPLESMAPGVRWIGFLLPLTWFVIGMRGIFLKGSDLAALALPFTVLVVMAVVVFGVALIRFRRDLAPKQRDPIDETPGAGATTVPT